MAPGPTVDRMSWTGRLARLDGARVDGEGEDDVEGHFGHLKSPFAAANNLDGHRPSLSRLAGPRSTRSPGSP